MSIGRQLIILSCLAAALAVFWLAPDVLHLDAAGMNGRAMLAQLGGPLVAAMCCAVAAWRSTGGDRSAWWAFAAGSALYLIGNLAYLFAVLANIELSFPSLPDSAFFVMAGFFAGGIFGYARVRERITLVQVYNFVLIFCAVALAGLFLLHESIAASVMTPFATSVAFLYPVLWFSVATFGLISLLLYNQKEKTLSLALLLLAIFAEAGADFSYALALMNGTYQLGGMPQLLWVASGGLIIWAAVEHIAMAKRKPSDVEAVAMRRPDRDLTQAVLPAAAVGVILFSGGLSGEMSSGPYATISMVLFGVFALVAGLREHRIIRIRRQLRNAVDNSREALARSQQQLSSVLESTSDSVLVLDRDWCVVYYNQNAARTINRSDCLRIGISVWELFPAAKTSGEGAHYVRAVETREPAEFEIFVEDRQAWLGIHAYPTADGLSIFFRDISEQRRVRDEIAYLAHHDPLTGLANRLLFQIRLEDAMNSGAQIALLTLDLDDFKSVNDTLGHPAGDELLVTTARRLREAVGEHDLVARLGGDEFVVLSTDCEGADEAGLLAERILTALSAPQMIDGRSIRVVASLGVALPLHGDESADQLFTNADIALHRAKTESRGVFRFFEPQMEAELQENQALRADLAVALDNGELRLAYQPLLDLKTSRVCSFEALLRWHHPTRGVVPPGVFIPIAEDTGLIIGIGKWVLRTACAEAATWPTEIGVAVNFSTRQFRDDSLIDEVEGALAASGLDPRRLEIEITESVLLEDSQKNMQTLRRLEELNIPVALDDFGTGYSSLGYLQRFPFSKIKIDRSFIAGLPSNDESQAIVRSVIGLGRSLGMRVTAEGVETEAQLDWVKLGCDEAQGYLLSRPIPASEVAPVIERLNARKVFEQEEEDARWAS